MCNRPARRARDKAQSLLQSQFVDLINDPINIVTKPCPLLFNFVIMGNHFGGAVMQFHLRIGVKTPLCKMINRAHLGLRNRATNLTPSIGKEFQGPLRCNARVNLTKRACRRITRIFVRLFTGFHLRCVHRLKISMINVNLAAHFEHIRPPLAFECLGNSLKRREVSGDIFTNSAVTPRRAANKLAILIAQSRRQAINLGFRRKRHRRSLI